MTRPRFCALTGTGAANEERPRWANGMLSFYIDPAQLEVQDFFPAEVDRYVDYFKSSRPAKAGEPVLAPGEPEINTRAKRLADGVPLPDDTWTAIARTALKVGLDQARIDRALAGN